MPVLPRVGDQFGRYRIDRQIGRGGMGVVYGATDTTIGRTVALKVVSAGLGVPAQAEEFRRRFEREASVLARLSSPHVIAIYDYGTHDDCPYIATQYVGGGDLGELVAERGPMPPSLALRVCAQVADALHDAHRVGVVHRDVKPTNVLLRDADAADPYAYLCDFGIARTATDGITRAGAVAGTWSYLAPEVGRGAPATPASDVYALGCLLWATLTGSPPYRGSDVEVAVAHQQAPVPQLDGHDELSGRIDEVLRRCLAKDPAQRYATADQARVDLLAAGALPDAGVRVSTEPPDRRPTVAARPAPVGPPPPPGSAPHLSLGSLPPRLSPPTPPPTGRRRRTTTVVALVCAAVVAVAGGVFALSRAGGDDSAGPGSSSSGPTTDPTSPTTPTTPTPTEPVRPERIGRGPVTGDLDGDGLGDLTVTLDRDVTTWRSTGTALVQQGAPERRPAATKAGYDDELLGDFDGDEVAEVLTVKVRTQEKKLVLSSTLSGGGTVSGEIAKEDAVPFVTVTDLDADGSDDLVIGYIVGTDKPPIRFLAVPIRDGRPQKPTMLLEVPYAYGEAYFQVGDLDGDRRGDIAVVRNREGQGDARPQDLTIWLGDGTSVRKGPSRTFPGEILTGYLAADIDGDDDLELVVTGGAGDSTVLRVLDVVDGQITKPRAIVALPRYGDYGDSLGVTDLDGDGRDDVVVVAKTARRQATLTAAISDGTMLVPTPAATWKVDLGPMDEYFAGFTVSARPSS